MIESLGFIFTVGGFVLSLIAMATANSVKGVAQEAKNSLMNQIKGQAEVETMTAAITMLAQAKDVALRRQSTDRRLAAAGKRLPEDIAVLQQAQDALATGLPSKLSLEPAQAAQAAAADLSRAIAAIQGTAPQRDAWRDALATLQILLPTLETEQRKKKEESLVASEEP